MFSALFSLFFISAYLVFPKRRHHISWPLANTINVSFCSRFHSVAFGRLRNQINFPILISFILLWFRVGNNKDISEYD